MYGQSRRHSQLPEHRPAARRIGMHQLERSGIGGPETSDRVHGDREERQVGGDDRHADPVRRRLSADRDAAETADDDRSEREDRDRLRSDDVRHDPASQHVELHEHDTQQESDDRAEREADGRRLRGEECGAEEEEPQVVASGRRLGELQQDRVDMRQRQIVDAERPAPTGALPEPLVPLPERPEPAEHQHEDEAPLGEPAKSHRRNLSHTCFRCRVVGARTRLPGWRSIRSERSPS